MFSQVLAQAGRSGGSIELKPQSSEFQKLGDITIPALISAFIKFALIIAALIAFAFLIFGGVKWIMSGGDKEQTAKAQGTITAALIGLVIVFAAWAIIRLIEVFFGVTILTLEIPSV